MSKQGSSNNAVSDGADVWCDDCHGYTHTSDCPAYKKLTQINAEEQAELGNENQDHSVKQEVEPFSPRSEKERQSTGLDAERIRSAAVCKAGVVYPCFAHTYHEITRLNLDAPEDVLKGEDSIQGFITSDGRFVGRFEAMGIAGAAGQIVHSHAPSFGLFSEDLRFAPNTSKPDSATASALPATEPNALAPEAECSNRYCLDGWVDEEQGTQDGTESYVTQVPCQVCCAHCDPESSTPPNLEQLAREAAEKLVAEKPLSYSLSRSLQPEEFDTLASIILSTLQGTDLFVAGVEAVCKIADEAKRKGLQDRKDNADADYDDGYSEAAQLIATEGRALVLTGREEAEAWQPIETAPEMRTVLLWADTSTPEMANWHMGSGFYHREIKAWVWEGETVREWVFPPTRWQPLPAPPSTTLKDSGAGEKNQG